MQSKKAKRTRPTNDSLPLTKEDGRTDGWLVGEEGPKEEGKWPCYYSYSTLFLLRMHLSLSLSLYLTHTHTQYVKVVVILVVEQS